MREALEARDDQVFIVRCWNEALGENAGDAIWRIRVSHLASGNERHFGDVGEVAQYIDTVLAEAHARQTRPKPN